MKLIIECTEYTYSECKKISGLSETAYVIAHGIPYNPTGDLISREALKKDIEKRCGEPFDYIKTIVPTLKAIDNAPTVDIKDQIAGAYNEGYMCGSKEAEKARPQGEWIIDGHHRRCNKCGEYFCIADSEGNEIPSNFCPNCGADMQKGGVE